MDPLRRLLPVLLLSLAPVLAACGDDGDDGGGDGSSGDGTTTEPTDAGSAPSTPTTPSTTAGVPTLPAACDVLTPEDVEAAYGVAFGAPEQGGGGHAEGKYEWQSDNCSFTAEALLEVKLALVGADDFSGAFACPEPTAIASQVEPVDGLGDQAWWEVDDAGPLEATLRVCTPSYDFDLELEYEDGVDYVGDPQTQTIALAGVVLAKLG